ncbi:MAG TPA: hypothetical protein VMX16_19880 [Terriglobia bacterium]|nr:hypothetical protein [Terriglobia bacterium]
MSRRDPAAPLRHMLDHANEAVAMIEGKGREDVDRDRQPVLDPALGSGAVCCSGGL